MLNTVDQDFGLAPAFPTLFTSGDTSHPADGIDFYCADLSRENFSCVTDTTQTNVSANLDPELFDPSSAADAAPAAPAAWGHPVLDPSLAPAQSSALAASLAPPTTWQCPSPGTKPIKSAASFASLVLAMCSSEDDAPQPPQSAPPVVQAAPFHTQHFPHVQMQNHFQPQLQPYPQPLSLPQSHPQLNSYHRPQPAFPMYHAPEQNLPIPDTVDASIYGIQVLQQQYPHSAPPSISLMSTASTTSPGLETASKHSVDSRASRPSHDMPHSTPVTYIPDPVLAEAYDATARLDCAPRRNIPVAPQSTDRSRSSGLACAGRAHIAKGSVAKQRRRYNEPRSSKYCHLCARHERAVEMVACGNLARGLCQKSVCRKCFTTYNLDWDAARASFNRLLGLQDPPRASGAPGANGVTAGVNGGESATAQNARADLGANLWQCPHCIGTCPKRAKCFAYDRQTVRRRAKTQEARLRAGSPTLDLPS